ncbi:MAG: methylenetetrahydrofolate reductase [NAD(P)H] [Muribaculum sp.]|nr:methylenetetrahydrofolate reductase [NAD(P)H] [Muribaculaceae bacterium]MCM1081544.1 methylenetetrahydrofolate reductase [NAD(P)H] [Muribaculum sp.]
MKVTDLFPQGRTGFSFEVLPPLKGKGIAQLFRNIDTLRQFDPLYINITTHRSEIVFRNTADGLYKRVSERSRPGTVAVAAAIQQKYGIPAVPHLICSGFSKIETEYALIDLNFLGITNLLLLRGDKAKHESRFVPNENGHDHATGLQAQVNEFNRGYFIDGTEMDIVTDEKFSYGVAGYPEKHEESPNIDLDIAFLKQKIDGGADYVVTQMFFDNQKYYDFVDRCRRAGIAAPIIPGLKPITTRSQLNILPKTFHVDMPMELANELIKCSDDNQAKAIGVEWCRMQAADLIAHGVPSIHFYSLNAVRSVEQVARQVY